MIQRKVRNYAIPHVIPVRFWSRQQWTFPLSSVQPETPYETFEVVLRVDMGSMVGVVVCPTSKLRGLACMGQVRHTESEVVSFHILNCKNRPICHASDAWLALVTGSKFSPACGGATAV
jgi:hypothetical protein